MLILWLSACGGPKPGVTTTEPEPTTPDDADGDGHDAASDCDDGDPTVLSGAEERCNGVDDDCDGAIDEEAVDRIASWLDADGDGHGDAGAPVWSCDATEVPADDCDDADSSAWPGNDEVCDGVDNDCDGEIDEGLEAWVDADGDGFGWDYAEGCEGAASPGDCDDLDPERHPDACDTIDVDRDCDGEVRPCLEGSSVLVLGPNQAHDGPGPGPNQVSFMGDVDGDGLPELT